MAISEEQNERLTEILQALEPEIKNLGQASANFVRDQIKRHSQYNEQIFVSPKQWAWLEDLYEKQAGGTKQYHRGEDRPDDEPDAERGGNRQDIDDEIPF